MVKQIISIFVVLIVLAVGSVFENDFVTRQFEELNSVLTVLYEKVDSEEATEQDVISVKENWLNKKKYLHIFIPHNDIKEIDLWLYESITLVKDKKWEDALSKIQVLIGLTKEIPKSFSITLENIM